MFIVLMAAVTLSLPASAPLVPHPCPRADAVPALWDFSPAVVCPALPDADDRAVIVRVYDRVGEVPSSVHRDARATASRILRNAGVKVRWLSCGPARKRTVGKVPACSAPLGDRELIVRLDRSTTRNDPAALGFSYVPGVVATALIDRIRNTAVRTGTATGALLGAVIAHEITHLLVGPIHLDAGLMQPVWTDADIRAQSPALFRGGPAERAAIRASARTGG